MEFTLLEDERRPQGSLVILRSGAHPKGYQLYVLERKADAESEDAKQIELNMDRVQIKKLHLYLSEILVGMDFEDAEYIGKLKEGKK